MGDLIDLVALSDSTDNEVNAVNQVPCFRFSEPPIRYADQLDDELLDKLLEELLLISPVILMPKL